MNIYATKRDGTREAFGGMIMEELEDAGFDADAELAYFDTREFEDEAATERSVEGISEFPEEQEGNKSELELDSGVSSVLQGVVEKFGGDPSDWHCTYTGSSDQFFDGEKLIDQRGVSIEGLIPEDRLAQYQELMETWKGNFHEVQHLEWWEKTDEGETIHVTALSLAENGEVLSETWSHTIESGKEPEQSDEEIGVVLENNPEFTAETVSDATPEELNLPDREDFDPDPRMLDLTTYPQESLSAEETSDGLPSVEPLEIPATPTALRPEVNSVEEPVATKIPENEPIVTAMPSGLHREAAPKERPAEVIAPAVDIPLDSNPGGITRTHETVLEFRAYIPEILEPVQGPEVAIFTTPTATEVNNPDITVFDESSELHFRDVNEEIMLNAPTEKATEEQIDLEFIRTPLEASPSKTIEQSMTAKPMSLTPEIAGIRDGVREMALRAGEVTLGEIALPRESVSRPITINRSLEGVRHISVLKEKPAEITAVTVEFVPAISATDAAIGTRELGSETHAQKTEAQREESVKNIVETSSKSVGKARETKLQDPEVVDTRLTDTALDTRKDEPKLTSFHDDMVESSAVVEKIADKSRGKKVESTPSTVLDRREILLRSFGLTSEGIRRYQGERQDGLRLAGTKGANNASSRASGITLVRDRRNGISLIRYAA